MVWDKHAAGAHARRHAGTTSHRRCAEFVRRAILAGGVDIQNTPDAKNYGSALEAKGFRPLGSGQQAIEGDVVVIQPYPGGNSSGHMAIFDGSGWYSDFRQRDMWGGPGYRAQQPAYVIYRRIKHEDILSASWASPYRLYYTLSVS
ncbi:hypothetical protein EGM70_14870 [Enterobacteriaceae bacterium 89]|nr:hypothetical protein [Enterobacteriaceae bacterium 89]